MSEAIIVALITAGLPTIATVITARRSYRTSARHSAKQSIFQMILEDHVSVQEGHLPNNYQSVLDEYDVYHKNGGNSYVTEKVERYKRWYTKIQAEELGREKTK